MDKNDCSHEVWIYCSSCAIDYEGSPVLIDNESNPNYCFNQYMCLSCGKFVEVMDYKTFEETHQVLKDYYYDIPMFMNGNDLITSSSYRMLYEKYEREYKDSVAALVLTCDDFESHQKIKSLLLKP